MAFGLTRVRAFGIEAEEPLNKRYIQRLILDITGLVADVDLDIGEYLTLGTFWTAVTGSEPGDTALQAIRDIATRSDSLIGFGGENLAGRLRVATTAGATDYEALVVNSAPSFTYTAPAPLSQTIVLEWLLGDDQAPVEVDASA